MSARRVIFGILAVIVAIGLSPPASAQTMEPPAVRWISWSLFAGNDFGTGLDEDSRGNFIVSGFITPNPDMLVAKFSSTGKKQWVHFPGSGWQNLSDYAYDVIATSDGNYLLAGTMGYYTCADPTQGCPQFKAACLMKFNARGKILWQQLYKDFPDSGFNAVVEDMDSNYVAVGYVAKNIIDETTSLLVVKVDESGNQVDDHQEVQGFITSTALGITTYVGDSGRPYYIVVGACVTGSGVGSSIYIIDLNEIFSYKNHGFYHATGKHAIGYSVVPAQTQGSPVLGGYVVAADVGGQFSLVRFPPSLSGDNAVVRSFGGLYGQVGQYGLSVKRSGIGEYVAAGTITSGNGSAAYVIHVNSVFDLEWEWKYGGAVGSRFGAWSAIPTKDGGFAVCGFVDSLTPPTNRWDLFLAKLGGATRGKKN